MSTKSDSFSNEYTKMWIDDGLLYIEYTEGLIVTLDVAQICVEARLKFCKGKSYPMLANITTLRETRKDAREYLSSAEGIKDITAAGFIVNNEFTRLMGTAFLSLNLSFNARRPPAKLFTDAEEASVWLKKYRLIGVS